nr:heavy-metal-associated domain-containing protein [Pedobacter panaciterrae]
MNSLRSLLVVGLTFLGSAVFAQSKTDKINVSGNCGMCKKRIETALKTEGVKTAVWDVKSKVLTVSYDSTKITTEGIQQKIAAVGHDTQKVTAKQENYSKLPSCCQYDRKSTDKK